MKELKTILTVAATVAAVMAAGAADTTLTSGGRVRFSMRGQTLVSNDVLELKDAKGALLENTDKWGGESVVPNALGLKSSWKGTFLSVEKFLDPHAGGAFEMTWVVKVANAPDARQLGMTMQVPAEPFDHLDKSRFPLRPDADGVLRLDGALGPVELTVKGGVGSWEIIDLREFKACGRFVLKCAAAVTPQDGAWTGNLVMRFAGRDADDAAVRARAAAFTARERAWAERALTFKPPVTVSTNGWYVCRLPWGGAGSTIEAGSALDASGLNGGHTAGAFGRLKVVGDHMEFEQKPGEEVPMWGVNIAHFGACPPKELAPGIADNLARQGVNLVRLHMFAVVSSQVDVRGFLRDYLRDRLDFFVAKLRERGVYVYLDWIDEVCVPSVWKRPPKEGEWGCPCKAGRKFAPFFVERTLAEMRDYARDLFTRKNPYTGLTYAEDPAVAAIEIINEATMGMLLNCNARGALDPEFYAALDAKWTEWNRARGKTVFKSFADDVQNRDRRAFCEETHLTFNREQRAFLRSLGYTGMIAGTNIALNPVDLLTISEGMEIAGVHHYWGYVPNYYNTLLDNAALLDKRSVETTLFNCAWERPKGRIYCAGEWNFCYPNDWRCEGLPYMAALMAYQRWGMSLFFAFTGPFSDGHWDAYYAKGNEAIFGQGQGTDPATWGLTVPCAYAFRRGDIAAARKEVVFKRTREELRKLEFVHETANFQNSWLFMLAKVFTETVESGSNVAAWHKPEAAWARMRRVADELGAKGCVSEKCLTSDTGEIKKFLDASLLLVDTPRSKFAIGDLSAMGKDGHELTGVRVRSREPWAALTLTSLTDEPVETSRRVLICLVGNARNERAEMRGNILVDPGWKAGGKVIAQPLEATLAFASRTPLRVYTLDTRTGRRTAELPRAANSSAVTLPASARTIYFELVRPEPGAAVGSEM